MKINIIIHQNTYTVTHREHEKYKICMQTIQLKFKFSWIQILIFTIRYFKVHRRRVHVTVFFSRDYVFTISCIKIGSEYERSFANFLDNIPYIFGRRLNC